jgi:hypothetical protein
LLAGPVATDARERDLDLTRRTERGAERVVPDQAAVALDQLPAVAGQTQQPLTLVAFHCSPELVRRRVAQEGRRRAIVGGARQEAEAVGWQ